MAERFQIISHSEDKLYQHDCPVICLAHNILYDNLTEELLLQAKFENLSAKEISELNLFVNCYDVSGIPLCENNEITYIGVTAKHRQTFGEQIPKNLSDGKTRKIEFKIKSIIFTDGSVWKTFNDASMEKLPYQQAVSKYLSEIEYNEEYKLLTPGVHSERKFPIFNTEYWLCTCGEINLESDACCAKCKIKKEYLRKIISKDYLRECIDKKKRAQQEKLLRSMEIKAQREIKAKKTATAVGIFLTVVAAVIFAVFIISQFILPKVNYNRALTLIAEEKYTEAYEILNAGGYEDAKIIIKNAEHTRAMNLAERDGKYSEAIDILFDIGGYSEDINQIRYNWALESIEKEDWATAAAALQNVKPAIENSDELKYDVYLKYVEVLKSQDNYEEALNWVPVSTDKSIYQLRNELRYSYAKQLMEKKDYKTAVSQLRLVGDYLDSEQLLNEAKYQYVLKNSSSSNDTTYLYLKDLKKVGYKDSAKIYNNLYAWKVEVITNSSESNERTGTSSISRYSPVYFHYKVVGGEPGTYEDITYVITYPDGSVRRNTTEVYFSGEVSATYDRWNGWKNGIYNNPYYGRTGTLSIKYYDSAGNFMGQGSVNITY